MQTVLSRVRGLPTPELIAEGTVEEWPYLIVTAVPGRPAGELWSQLEPDDQADVVSQLGHLMRRLHEHAVPPELPADWDGESVLRVHRAVRLLHFGRPGLSRLLVESYGLTLAPELADRLTTWCLLHEFGRLSDFLAVHPAANGAEFYRALWADVGSSA